MYLYASDEEVAGQGVTAGEFFRRLGRRVTAGLNELTSEGYVYRVDLRLRPEGAGDNAYSMEAFEHYYRSRVGTWDRLALLKTWPVAGSRALGLSFLEMARKFIYDQPFELKALNDVRSVKQQIDQKMRARRGSDCNVKLGTGGIREIELIAQSFQVSYGSRIPEIRERNTLKALTALFRHSLISAKEHEALRQAYLFLRDAENKLQMANDTQTHNLPKEPEELAMYSRLLGYAEGEEFMREYRLHTGRVHGVFESVFGPGGLQRLLSGH
jgi:glutamate-ammonia-ligase adenylyltransferase